MGDRLRLAAAEGDVLKVEAAAKAAALHKVGWNITPPNTHTHTHEILHTQLAVVCDCV